MTFLLSIGVTFFIVGLVYFLLWVFIFREEEDKRMYNVRIKEVYEKLNKPMTPYSKVVKMDLDTMVKIGLVNKKRFKFEKPGLTFNYPHILYNANQEDKVEREEREMLVQRDKDGKVISYSEIPYMFPGFFYNTSLHVEKVFLGEETTKAEDVWTKENTVIIVLSFEDHKRFLQMVDNEQKRKEMEKEAADLQFVIRSAQADIHKLQEQSQKEIEQANDMVQQVIENITLQG